MWTPKPGRALAGSRSEHVNRKEKQARIQCKVGLRARPLVLSIVKQTCWDPAPLGLVLSSPRPRSADSSGLRGQAGLGPRRDGTGPGSRRWLLCLTWRWGDFGQVPGPGGPRCRSFGVHVTAGVFGQVIAAHEAPLTHTTHKLLLTGVSPAVTGKLIRAGKLLLTAVPVTTERFLT